MTLHEAIQRVLREHNRPMTTANLAAIINERGYYERGDREPLTAAQVSARVKNYPSLFQPVNGFILLVQDEVWKDFLTGYQFIGTVLKGIYNPADVLFIAAALLYAKRVVDRHKHLQDMSRQVHSLQDLFEVSAGILTNAPLSVNFGEQPREVLEDCAHTLTRLESYKREELWQVVRPIQTQKLTDLEFGTMFDYLLGSIAPELVKSALQTTPYSLRQLMVGLLDPEPSTEVFDPVAGAGGLLIEVLLQKGQTLKVSGSEINKRIAQLGNLNLLAHGFYGGGIIAEDCFERVNELRRYDYIIADLPANGVTNSWEHRLLHETFQLTTPRSGKSFGALVLFSFLQLNNLGKAVLTVSDGFLIKKGREMDIRRLLIQEDVLESVISLPYGTLRPYTDAKASVIVLNKQKPGHLRGRVQLITAQALEQGSKSLTLDVEGVLDAYALKQEFAKNAQLVEFADLRSDLNLSVDAYGPQYRLGNQLLKENKARKLGDLVDMRAGIMPERSDVHRDGQVPLIKIENLSKDILDLQLDARKADRIDLTERYQRYVIERDCILVAKIGDHLKATLFRPTPEVPRILTHSNVTTLLVNPAGGIQLEYLYYQLHSVFVLEQIDRRKLGTVMPYISISALKEVLVPYMSVSAQDEFVQSQKANLIAEERERVEARFQALGYQEETKNAEADVIKTLTHQLRPTVTNLNHLVQRIERIIERERLGELPEYAELNLAVDPEVADAILRPDNFKLQQLLGKLTEDSEHLSHILSNVDKVMNFKLTEEDLLPVELKAFLTRYQQRKLIDDGHRYEIRLRAEPAVVALHEPSFKELLDQLLNNADRHAFPQGGPAGDRYVQFTLRVSAHRNVAVLEYTNNGLPYELTQKDFVTAFEKGQSSTGSGIGGNYINRIVEAHAGKLTILENQRRGFGLVIELPLITT